MENEQKIISKRTSVHSCVTMYVTFYHAWPKMIDSFFSFPPSLLLLLSYTVFCSGHSYHLWNHVWPWDSLGIHTAIRGGYEMVPKVQGTIHILRNHILCFGGPLLHKHLFMAENKQKKLPFSNPPTSAYLIYEWSSRVLSMV